MRALIGAKDCDIDAGSLFSELVEFYENKLADEPMIKAVRERTGRSHLIYSVNGRIIRPEQFTELRLQEGDDVRIHHPCFGG